MQLYITIREKKRKEEVNIRSHVFVEREKESREMKKYGEKKVPLRSKTKTLRERKRVEPKWRKQLLIGGCTLQLSVRYIIRT